MASRKTPKRIKNRFDARKPIKDAMRQTSIPKPKNAVRMHSLKGLSSKAASVSGKRKSMVVKGIKRKKPKELLGAYKGMNAYHHKEKKSHEYNRDMYSRLDDIRNSVIDPHRRNDMDDSDARLAVELANSGLAGHTNQARRFQRMGEIFSQMRRA